MSEGRMSNKISKDSQINIKIQGEKAIDTRSFLFSLYAMKSGRA
jgi:hypothetical protein